jgi:hypothetical protein
MVQRQTVTIQHGVWIDGQRLADAGLNDRLEITVGPGEIRIRSPEPTDVRSNDADDEPLLQLAGTLSGPPVSSSEIDRQLYGEGNAEK